MRTVPDATQQTFGPLGKRVCVPEPKRAPKIERLGPKLWSVDGKFQDTDPTPRPPPAIPNWEGLHQPMQPEIQP